MTDSILVVGGGVSGIRAALDCADGGARVTLVERAPILGGRLAAPMTAETAIGERAEGEEIPMLEALAEHGNIETITNATLESVDGRPGNFDVTIRERARFVTDACTRCKLCHTACPVVQPNEFDAGLTFRKAIYTPMAETVPAAYVIDIDSCLNTPPNYLPCNRCVEVCDDDAIHFDEALESVHERHVGAVILAPGFQLVDSTDYEELGYGKHPDILTSAELQRFMEVPGPSGGYATRPSNEEYPENVLLVIDALSRFALYIVASQVRQLLEQDVSNVAILVLAQPGTDDETRKALEFAESTGIALKWGTMFDASSTDDGQLQVSYEDFSASRFTRQIYDLVVLCTDVCPPDQLDELATTAGIELRSDGYLPLEAPDGERVSGSRPGVFVAGCGSGPKTIKESVSDARLAASSALAQIDPRLLQADGSASVQQGSDEGTGLEVPDVLQSQIESLLYALLDKGNP